MGAEVKRENQRWVSPLRYPGGKARMAAHLDRILDQQTGILDIEIWIEPFAGGAGAGLALLDRNLIPEVWLTERNHALATFWDAAINDGETFARRIERTTVTMNTWDWARGVLARTEETQAVSDDDVALAAFIINRCSRSGIVNSKVGPIGGKNQTGRWTVASRFNPEALASRIRHVHSFQGRLRVREGDAIEHIADLAGSGIEHEVFLFVDPPYVREGNRLYEHGMTRTQHEALAGALHGCPSRWLLTYDDDPLVSGVLYPQHRILAYEIAHTANRQRVDWEYAVLSDNLAVEDGMMLLPAGDTRWVRNVPALERMTG